MCSIVLVLHTVLLLSYLSSGIWFEVHPQCVGQTKLHVAVYTLVSTPSTGSGLGGWAEVMWRKGGGEREKGRKGGEGGRRGS